jgi:hypothetical protein
MVAGCGRCRRGFREANTRLGKFAERDLPDYSGRDWNERAFTIGIGGCVVSRRRCAIT